MKTALLFFALLSLPLFSADVHVVVVNQTTETRQIQVRNSDRLVVGTITVPGGGTDSRTWSAEALDGGVVQLWVGDYLESQVKLPSLESRQTITVTISADNRLSVE